MSYNLPDQVTIVINCKTQLLFLLQEKTRQYEEEKDRVRSSRQEMKKRTDEEVDVIRQDLVHMSNKVSRLQDELREKEELNLQLR